MHIGTRALTLTETECQWALGGRSTDSFSPDGNYIAFIANVPDAQVHTVELATGAVKQLTNLTGIGLRIS